ncbi:hypothetical protein ACVWZ4_004681 [Bradyrhizobium sp. USDA 4472]
MNLGKIVTVNDEIIIGLSRQRNLRSGPFACVKPQYKVTDYAPDMVFQDACDEHAEEGPAPVFASFRACRKQPETLVELTAIGAMW